MRRAMAAAILALVVAVVSTAGARARQAPSAPTMTDRFGWLAGCWGGESGQTTFREIWTIASPDLMIGMSTTMAPARPASFEFLRIVRANGAFAYVAQPGGVPPTTFPLSDLTKPDVNVFVNLQHDFPKRVGYERVGTQSLRAWIDGGEGATKRIDYPMTRGKGC